MTETDTRPWPRDLWISMTREHILHLSEDQISTYVRNQLNRMLEEEGEMSDWELWCFFDQVGMWHHGHQVSSFVGAALWPWPFYDAPDRPGEEPESTHWAFTWPGRPHSTLVAGAGVMDRGAVTVRLQKQMGSLPEHLQMWPCDTETGRML